VRGLTLAAAARTTKGGQGARGPEERGKGGYRASREDAAVATIIRKKEGSYNKMVLKRTGIVHRQAARWATKWIMDIKKRRKQFVVMLAHEFMPSLER
jgi:hypothetical protein